MAKSLTGKWQDPQEGDDSREGWRFADHLDDMISAHSPDGTYRYASAAARHLLGYEPDELVGTDSFTYFHPDDVDRVSLAHRSALGGAPFTVVYRLRRKDGEYVWVETTSKVVSEHEGRDVTEIVCSTRAVDLRRAENLVNAVDHAAEMTRIERLLESESLVSVFQPIFDLEAGSIVAIEALARFPGDPAHTPERWFADAWDIGLGVPLELQAARTASAAVDALGEDVALFINASPQVVAAPGFLQSLGPAIDRVTVEVTEHLRVNDYAQLELELADFRAAGGQLAIDDFGAGFASFRHILELRPEWIKLDRTLVAQIGISDVARGLAEAVSTFARNVDVKVIAEGIETPDELDWVRQIGIRYGQGYQLARPSTLEQALAAKLT